MTRPSGSNSSQTKIFVMGILALAAFALAGCDDDMGGGGSTQNLPPGVWLISAPPEGDSTSYRVHLEWGGSDPDGKIAYYEYAITDNDGGVFVPEDTVGRDKWHKVFAEDSMFIFTADELADSTTEDPVSRFERSHTFFIRAVDNGGLASLEPAYRSFTAWTLSPTALVILPHNAGTSPALMPRIGTYRWVATDYVSSKAEPQDPDSVRWILHPVENSDYTDGIDFICRNPHSREWYPWFDYKAPGGAGRAWTTPPIDAGAYVFAVQAKDEAGAVTPVFDESRNVRRIRVSSVDSSPLLDVYNEYIGTIRTSSATAPTVIVDLPATLPVTFSWTASAQAYGGIVTGFRYGWDIANLDDPDQWETDYTPFVGPAAASPPREFFFGVHTFHVEVIDNSGWTSRVEVKVNVVPFTMSRDLLLVDDFNIQSSGIVPTNGAVPSDAEHDAFWQSMLGDVAGFSPDLDVISVIAGTDLPLTSLADYKTIIWDAYGGYNISKALRPKLWDLIHYRSKDPLRNSVTGKVRPNLLALFVRIGGHVMVCGHQPMTQAITGDFFSGGVEYPFIFKYELEGNQDGVYRDQFQAGEFVGDWSFPYRDACLNVLDIAYPGVANLRTDALNECGVKDTHGTDPRTNGLRAAYPLDPRFPQLELRDEVAGPGRHFAPETRGLNAELYNPPYFSSCNEVEFPARSCFEPVYGHGCLDVGSTVYNAPVAFWSAEYADVIPEQGGGRPARSFFLGVEPYYFNPTQVREMIDLILFDEWGLPRI